MKTITVNFIMKNRPCNSYTEDRVRELIGDGKTPLEILDLEIPAEDRVWVLTRDGVLSKEILVEFALRAAERVLPVFEKKIPNDNRPRVCLEAARKYQNGELSEEELKNAAAAIRAARAAFAFAFDAFDAARAAAAAAGAAGAAFAFAFAAFGAAYYATAADSEQREQENQIADLRKLLTEEMK